MENQNNVTENPNLEESEKDYSELKLKKVLEYFQEKFNEILKDDFSKNDYDLELMGFDILEILKKEDFIIEQEKVIMNAFIKYSIENQCYLKENSF
jgi:hypothetical protein